MHAAWSAALRSSCMSRQVGAAICDERGAVLATGTNDPPAPGGGLYSGSEREGIPDGRCFKLAATESKPYCWNDRKKEEIYADIVTQLTASNVLVDGADAGAVQQALERTRVRDLIEFSRAIHAEMDALLSLARGEGGSSSGAILYCTTYPCHSCARHIVAAGLREVVYIEPYAKSLALELHADAIREVTVAEPRGESADPRVVFRLFSGVAPRRFSALFEKRGELKDGRGYLVDAPPGPAHTARVLTRSFLQLEEQLARTVAAALQPGGKNDADQAPSDPPRG